ncbi:olfactory receptor 5J3-like [Lissotriton helveticus]
MKEENQTSTKPFFILGFGGRQELQILLFICFLLIYLVTLIGNLLIVTIVCSNTHLHRPMYFFLTNLSCIDIICPTIVFPKMLVSFFLGGTYVSHSKCLLQMYGFNGVVSTELNILVVMALDRYVAICNPLLYLRIMNKNLCVSLAAGAWLVGLLDAIPHTVLISKLSFCGSHTINHFFCDATALLRLSCTSTQSIETLTYVLGPIVAIVPCGLIAASYMSIISSILKIQSTEGRQKAFSTCVSHLTVVISYYGSLCFTYMRPASAYSEYNNKYMSLSYIAVTPLCNPIIYSLKNTEFKKAMRKSMNIDKMLNLKYVCLIFYGQNS